MTSDRAEAYGRVVATIDDMAATKLQPGEVERLREAADTLLFSETLDAPGARAALDDVEDLTDALKDSGRWLPERAQRLYDDVAECGPVVPA
jgi:hypothetical protein